MAWVTDKQDHSWVTPLSPVTRSAIDRRLATLGDSGPNTYLFPSPSDPAVREFL